LSANVYIVKFAGVRGYVLSDFHSRSPTILDAYRAAICLSSSACDVHSEALPAVVSLFFFNAVPSSEASFEYDKSIR